MVSNALERVVTVVLQRLGMHLWGFPPRLMAPIVVQLGPLRALGWFIWNMPRYQRTLKAFGPIRTHLICTTISLVNGCRYCGFGHGYALELAYLREHGRLFPLGKHSMVMLRGLSPGLIRHRMADAARRAGLHSEVRWLERAIELTVAEDRRPTDDDDVRICHLVRMFGVLNSVGISDDTEPDEAHSPLNKDRALKVRHARLQAGAGT